MVNVSIIIPVYNVEEYLKECLESVVNQSLKNIEIICINDGSTDKSLDILKEYELLYKNIKVISQENKGLSNARNVGVKNANGEFIYFMDSDDYIELEAMEICYKEAKKNRLDIITFDAKIFIHDNYNKEVIQEYYREELIGSQIMRGEDFYIALNRAGAYRSPVWLNFYRRNYLNENKIEFYDGIVHEDELYTAKSYINAKRIKYIPHVFFYRRIRKNSVMTAEITTKRIKGNFIVANEIYELTKNTSLLEETKEILKLWIEIFYKNSITFCDLLDEYDYRKKIEKEIKSKKDIITIELEMQIDSPNLFYLEN